MNIDGDHLCVYLGDASSGIGNPAYDPNGTYLYVIKDLEPAQLLNPTTLAVKNFRVYLQPLGDPTSAGSSQEENVTILGSVTSSTSQYSATIPLDISVAIQDYAYPAH